MRFLQLAAALAALTCSLLAGNSSVPRDVQAELARARELYYKGIKGDKNALRESDRLFARLHSAAPDRPVVQAYYGSLRLLEAGRTWALWRKNALSREGLQHLDQAVERSPGDLEVRFLRAATTYHLPGFFARDEQCAADFAFVAGRAAEASAGGELHPNLAAAALFYHGELLAKSGQSAAARAAWNSAVRLAPNSPAGVDAARRLSSAR